MNKAGRAWKELGDKRGSGAAWALEDGQRRYAYLDPLGSGWTVKVCVAASGVRDWLSSSPPLSLDAAKAWAEEALRRVEQGEHPRDVARDLTQRTQEG